MIYEAINDRFEQADSLAAVPVVTTVKVLRSNSTPSSYTTAVYAPSSRFPQFQMATKLTSASGQAPVSRTSGRALPYSSGKVSRPATLTGEPSAKKRFGVLPERGRTWIQTP